MGIYLGVYEVFQIGEAAWFWMSADLIKHWIACFSSIFAIFIDEGPNISFYGLAFPMATCKHYFCWEFASQCNAALSQRQVIYHWTCPVMQRKKIDLVKTATGLLT